MSLFIFLFICGANHIVNRGAQWPSGRASDSGARGWGFETYLRRVVSLRKTLYSPKVIFVRRDIFYNVAYIIETRTPY